MTTTATAIRAFDYVEQYAAIEEEILTAVREVLSSGKLILGPRVRSFEENFAEYLGGGYGVGVASGTDALAIALRALGVGPGDEVITVANTALPTVAAIRMTGARPVFCEIDPTTLLMDPTDVVRRITPRTRALVPVHLYGNAADMPALVHFARQHNLAVVEDCAQSVGTTFDGQPTGTFGDVGCYSFYPTKNLGAYGDGGFCFTRRRELSEAMRQIRVYGQCGPGVCSREGVNSRLDELQAAVLDVKLRQLNVYLEKRRAIARLYDQHLAGSIARPRAGTRVEHSYHLYVILPSNRGRVVEHLDAEDIGYGIHYPTPLYQIPAYREPGDDGLALPLTERAARQVLSLPCYPELSPEAVRRVCRVVNEICD